jgi:hypothetical protein
MPDFDNQAIQERLIQEVKEMVESGNPPPFFPLTGPGLLCIVQYMKVP